MIFQSGLERKAKYFAAHNYSLDLLNYFTNYQKKIRWNNIKFWVNVKKILRETLKLVKLVYSNYCFF